MKSIKEKLAYLISGGLLVAVGMTLSPVTAQKDKFGEIECTKLTVVDANGKARVKLDEYGVTCIEGFGFRLVNADGNLLGQMSRGGQGGYIGVYGWDGDSNVLIGFAPTGSLVRFSGKNFIPKLTLGVDIDGGGYVRAYDKDMLTSVSLSIDAYGGQVAVNGKYGSVSLTNNEYGGGVTAYGYDGNGGNPMAGLSINENGGRVQVKGKGEGKAVMGVNEYGNGAVSTWDKNGLRQ